MSDLLDSQKNQDDHLEESEPVTSDSPTEGISDGHALPVPTEIPLPDFGQDQAKHPPVETPAEPVDSATDDDLLDAEIYRPEVAPQGVYKVSSAEPNLSEFTFSPLEDSTPDEEPNAGWKTVWAVVREVGETILLTLIIFFLIQTVIRNFRVVGTSMVDNLHNGQYLIIDKLSYSSLVTEIFGFGGPQRGDVIVFEPPNRPGEDYVKRIIALPGETVEIVRGQVLINGEPLDETFQPRHGSYSMPPQVVPEGEVFVLGDNRNNSNDSHNWGSLPLENVVGRAWLSYWPPDQWGTIPRDTPSEEATLRNFLHQLVPNANAESE